MVECKYCSINIKPLGRSAHERYCKQNPDRLTKGFGGQKKGCVTWNKGKTTPQEVKDKISNSNKGKSIGRSLTEEGEVLRKLRISKSMKKNPNAGGIRKGSGFGKKGYYMGIWCDSTWELAFVIYNLEHSILFVRNQEGFEYTFKGKICKYYPDFIIDNIYYEIKGRHNYNQLDLKTKAKIDSFRKSLVVLYYHEMIPIFKYVISKYGKDFHLLYDK
jgi:hypothetical protein